MNKFNSAKSILLNQNIYLPQAKQSQFFQAIFKIQTFFFAGHNSGRRITSWTLIENNYLVDVLVEVFINLYSSHSIEYNRSFWKKPTNNKNVGNLKKTSFNLKNCSKYLLTQYSLLSTKMFVYWDVGRFNLNFNLWSIL